MAGTNPVGAYAETNSTSQTPTAWFGQADANSAVAMRATDLFAPRPAASPAMSVVVDPGFVVQLLPTGQQTVVEQATAQTVTIAAAPGAPNNRIDLVVVDAATGAASVVAGAPATTAAAPALPPGKFQVAQVSVPNGTSSIVNSNITDLRALWGIGVPSLPWAVGSGTGNAITATYTPANGSLTDGLMLAVRAPGANTSTAPTFAPDGLTAATITKAGGAALAAGDVPGQYAELVLRYNLAHTRWELLNTPSGVGVLTTVTGASTLASSTVDGTVLFGGSAGYTTTLPAVPAANHGLLLCNTSANAQTVMPTTGVNIVYGGITTYTTSSPLILPVGSSCRIVSDGTNWFVTLASGIVTPTPTSAQIATALGYTPASTAQIGGLSAVVTTATNLQLQSYQQGTLVRLTGSASFNLGLPVASSVPGGVFEFVVPYGQTPYVTLVSLGGNVYAQSGGAWVAGVALASACYGRAVSDGADWYVSILST